MPIAGYETYCKMLDRAKENRFAYPAINVSSLTTANAVRTGSSISREQRFMFIGHQYDGGTRRKTCQRAFT